jgi:hypothetical protein
MMSCIRPAPTFRCRMVTDGDRDPRCGMAPRTLAAYAAAAKAILRFLAPYAAIVALPGGSLLALLLWLYRRRAARALGRRRERLPPAMLGLAWESRSASPRMPTSGRTMTKLSVIA